MAEELKACPFCGRIPKTSHRPESEASGGGHVAFVVCYCGGYASTAHQMGHAETVQAAIAEVVEKWNTRAQLPSQGGEAVEVVASIAVDAEGVVRDFTLEPGLDRHPGGYTVTLLMTVAQHQRILAASVGSAEPVAWQVVGVHPKHRHPHKVVEYSEKTAEGQAAHWRNRGCTVEVTPLYTHPADQVADGAAVKLREAFPLFDETGLSETEHHCEWSILQERKRLHSVLDALLAKP